MCSTLVWSKLLINSAIIQPWVWMEALVVAAFNEVCRVSDTTLECEDPVPKLRKMAVCTLCLDALQNCLSPSNIASKVIAPLTELSSQFSSYALNVSVPVSLIVRHRIAHLYLKKNGEKRELNDIPSVKEVIKLVINSYIKTNFKAINVDLDSPFHINVILTHPEVMEDCQFLAKLFPKSFPRNGKNLSCSDFSHKLLDKLLESTNDEDILRRKVEIPPAESSVSCKINRVHFEHDSIFLAGRYNKYSRELSQTPWVIDGDRIMKTSVQELITEHIFPLLKPNGEYCKTLQSYIIFSASGREDVDVRCLGLGRPFVLECVNPRNVNFSQNDLNDIEKTINSSTTDIAVKFLQKVSKNEIQKLKEGEQEKTKIYSCICCCKDEITQEQLNELNKLQNIIIGQKTPMRVLHRRNLDTRKRSILEMSAKLIEPHKFSLKLTTEAGTYIKEFVHGDFGRTIPSLSHFLHTETDIIALDVDGINIDWPPEIKSKEIQV
ncbi:putative tRNA pseudouridine synthase Pus10 [Nymphon striatum]|nr:putative tRNA pseudouridine synthase Pus10 [Nymphon striatum]